MTEDTTNSPVDAVDVETQSKRRGRLHGWKATIAAGVFLALVVVNMFWKLPYFVLSPGDTVAVNQYVQLPADRENKPKGSVMLTTVALLRAHPFDIAWAWATDGTEIVKKKEILGTSTTQQFNDISAKQMAGSQLAAKYVALQLAGVDVGLRGDGATVRAIAEDAPVKNLVHVGDTITAVDGKVISLAPDVSAAIKVHKPGESVVLSITDSSGGTRTQAVTVGTNPQDSTKGYVGVSIETKNLDLALPFPVTFKSTDIGGPSAGLAFTLALLDDLTPGELTGGGKIAATGTIDGDGKVGEIGGVEQKTRSVRDSGASLFLVPSSEADEARRFAGKKLKIVGVDSIEQAVAALRDNGGDVSGLPGGVALKPGV